MTTKYIINGHSENTNDTFQVPPDMEIVFYANEDQKCIITDSTDGFDFVINTINEDPNYSNVFMSGSYCKDYLIDGFDENNMLYVYEIRGNNYISVFRGELEDNEFYLETLCYKLRINTNGYIVVYCTFCRGTMEADDRGIFDYDTSAMQIGDNMDYGIGNTKRQNQNANMFDDDYFNNMDWSSGGKKSKKRRTKNTRKKHKKRKSKKRQVRYKKYLTKNNLKTKF